MFADDVGFVVNQPNVCWWHTCAWPRN